MKNRVPASIDDSPFLTLLCDQERGRFLERVEVELKKVVSASAEMGGKGKLTVEFVLVTALTGNGGAKTKIQASVKSSAPVEQPGTMMRFAMRDGSLASHDHEDVELALGDGDGADEGEPKVVRMRGAGARGAK